MGKLKKLGNLFFSLSFVANDLANEKFNMQNYIVKLNELGEAARLIQEIKQTDFAVIKNNDLT